MTQMQVTDGGGFYAHITLVDKEGTKQHIFDRVVTFVTFFEDGLARDLEHREETARYGTSDKNKYFEAQAGFVGYIHETELSTLMADTGPTPTPPSAPKRGAPSPSKLVGNVVPPRLVRPTKAKVDKYG